MLRFLQLLPGLGEGGTGQVAPVSHVPPPPMSCSTGKPQHNSQVEEDKLLWDGSVLPQDGFSVSWDGPELPQEMDSTCLRTHLNLPKDLNCSGMDPVCLRRGIQFPQGDGPDFTAGDSPQLVQEMEPIPG